MTSAPKAVSSFFFLTVAGRSAMDAAKEVRLRKRRAVLQYIEKTPDFLAASEKARASRPRPEDFHQASMGEGAGALALPHARRLGRGRAAAEDSCQS